MIAYLDTSASANSIFADMGHQRIDRWIEERRPTMFYRDWMYGEFVAAVARRLRATGLDDATGEALIVAADRYLAGWSKEAATTDDLASAIAFVRKFHIGLHLPDAIHVAVAQRLGATLITTDRQQFRAAKALGILAVDPTLPE